MKGLITSIVFLLSIGMMALAQSPQYVVLDKSTMKIDGTSNIHDWTCEVEQIQSDIRYNASALKPEQQESPVEALTLTIPVKGIESGKGGMNKKMYDALKEEEHPEITFRMMNSTVNGYTGSGEQFTLEVEGRLTIAGVTKNVSIPVSAERSNGSAYKFSGTYEINMTDYDIEPPSALFGTVSAGEKVTVSFEFYVGS